MHSQLFRISLLYLFKLLSFLARVPSLANGPKIWKQIIEVWIVGLVDHHVHATEIY